MADRKQSAEARVAELEDTLYKHAMGEIKLTDEEALKLTAEYDELVPDAKPE